MRKLNLKLLLWLLVGVVLTAGVAFGVHELQVSRSAHVLLARANEAYDEERWSEALELFSKYHGFVPKGSGDSVAKVGLLQADARRYPQAARNLEIALAESPDREDIRHRLVEVQLALGRFSDARRHLGPMTSAAEKAREKAIKDGDTVELARIEEERNKLYKWLAQCQIASADYEGAVGSFDKICEAAPTQLDTWMDLAVLYSTDKMLNDLGQAMKVLDEMVTVNPESCRAYAIRGTQRLRVATNEIRQTGASRLNVKLLRDKAGASRPQETTIETATEDATKALALCPDDDAAIMLMVNCLMKANRLDEARELAARGLALHPKVELLYTVMADIELTSQNRAAAIDWLKKGLALFPSHKDFSWNLALLLVEEGRVSETRELIPGLVAAKYPSAPIDFLKARLLMEEREWYDASRLLEKIRPNLVGWPTLLKQADLRLGQCYKALRQPDLQLTAFRRASGSDPTWIPARMGVAEALVAKGDTRQALQEYEQLARIQIPNPLKAQVLLDWARLLIVTAQRGREDSARSWQLAGIALDGLEKIAPGAPEVPILRSEVLLGSGDRQKAEELLQRAFARSPKSVEYRLGLSVFAERRGDFDEAQRLLDEAKKDLGDSVELRLAQARHLQVRRDPEIQEKLRKLTEGADAFSEDERLKLYTGVAAVSMALNDFDETERLLRLVARENQSLLQVRLQLFDLALVSKRTSALEDLIKEIERIEGTGPLWNYATAVHSYVMALKARDEKKQDELSRLCLKARAHLEAAAPLRPEWTRIPLLLAQVAELQQDDAAAMLNYARAIDLGEKDVRVLSHAVVLLYQHQRFKEASELISHLKAQGTLFSSDMLRLAAEISLQTQDNRGALEWTTQFAKSLKGSNELVWLGQKQWVLEQYDEAEKNFRKAIAVDETAPEPRVAFVLSLAARLTKLRQDFAGARVNPQRRAEAVKLAADVENLEIKIKGEIETASQKVVADKAPLALALCYESIGDTEQAEARYQEFLKAAPADLGGLRRVADFYCRLGRPSEAVPYFEQITAPSSKASPEERHRVRRDLAMTLADCRDQTSVNKAVALMKENLQDEFASVEDRRVHGKILASVRTRTSWRDAAKTFEDLVTQQTAKRLDPLPEDLYNLVQIYINLGDQTRADKWMRELVSHPNFKIEPRYVAEYIAFLLSRNDVEQADLWVRRLELSPRLDLATISLRADIDVRRGQYDRVLPLMERFVQAPTDEYVERKLRRKQAAAVLEKLAAQMVVPPKTGTPIVPLAQETAAKLLARAEELYSSENDDSPRDFVALATFFNRQGKHGQSLDLLERKWTQAEPQEISVVASALLASPTTSTDEFDRAEKVLEGALEKHSRANSLVLALADIRNWRGDYEGAERLYREVLQKDARHAVAMNNLSLLLALQGIKLDESLALIQRAIDMIGQDPSLVDTRATVLLMKGDTQRAARDLGHVIDIRPSGLAYFHQAEVSLKLGQKEAARESLAKAKENGIVVMSLHPIERKRFADLDQELN